MSYLNQALNFRRTEEKKTPEKTMEAIFRQTLDDINRRYEPGAIVRIKENHPDLWQKVLILEEGIEKAWLAGDIGFARKAVKEYVGLICGCLKNPHTNLKEDNRPPL